MERLKTTAVQRGKEEETVDCRYQSTAFPSALWRIHPLVLPVARSAGNYYLCVQSDLLPLELILQAHTVSGRPFPRGRLLS